MSSSQPLCVSMGQRPSAGRYSLLTGPRKKDTVLSHGLEMIPTESRVVKLATCKDFGTCEFQDRGRSRGDHFVPCYLDDSGTELKDEVNRTCQDG